MKVVKTLRHKITNHTRIFDGTLTIYNQAITFIMEVMDYQFNNLDDYTTNTIVPDVEKLIHHTKSNPLPKYHDFDTLFYKFPSYFRRGAIATAFGKVKSYRSNYRNWEEERKIALQEGKNFTKKPPRLQLVHKEFPVFYRGNMFNRMNDTTAQIKIFHQNDWIWIDIQFKGQDLYKREVWDWKECNPKLVQVGKKYFLNVPYQTKVKLSNTKMNDQKICAVDLGITNSAVCSIMDANGTVLDRKFINQPKEKDQLYTMTNKLRRAQRTSGWIKAPNFWRRINGLQRHIVHDTAERIVTFAKKHNCDVIVFEFLDKMRTPKGFYGAKKLRFKLHYWRKKGIQNKVKEMAHYQGIRFSRVNARNTSKLAFDGSGEIERNNKGDVATFSTGKIYQTDLSASYNIGARYFIRGIQKSTSEKKWLALQAKVPELSKRTQQTLSSLIALRLA